MTSDFLVIANDDLFFQFAFSLCNDFSYRFYKKCRLKYPSYPPFFAD